MNFNQILADTLSFEGGQVNDNGIPTNFGVRQDMYDSYTKSNKIASKRVSDLTYGDVHRFYKSEYYDKPKLSSLPDKVQGVLFDAGVNMGQGTSIKQLQKLIGTKADGIIGDKTLKAVKKYVSKNGEDNLLTQLLNARQMYYDNLVIKDPMRYGANEQGWRNRVEGLRKKVLP